tara:strand:+ start:1108 stop:1716 length:609 start_codon:yes stop_codon:yes gene_type:complete
MPDFSLEDKTFGIVAGIDEAGRGSWAGPVYAAAVVLDRQYNYEFSHKINDSKKLSPRVRKILFHSIITFSSVGVGQASVKEIDSMNILQATHLAMRRALRSLPETPRIALVDGNSSPCFDIETTLVTKGDSISMSIAAASIVAKVSRDNEMVRWANQYPGYGFETHKGYGTKNHMLAIKKLGPSAIHRQSFKPIKKYSKDRS